MVTALAFWVENAKIATKPNQLHSQWSRHVDEH
jgi:hypothetical protein